MSSEGTLSRDLKGKHPRILRSAKHREELEARREPAQRYATTEGAASGVEKPSDECKLVVFQVLYMRFMDKLYTYLNRNYLALGEVVGKEAIQSKM
jgi:hypothetical protein